MAKAEGFLAKARESINRAKATLRGIGGDIAGLRENLATLKAQRDVVANAPMSDDEVRAKIKLSLDGYEAFVRDRWWMESRFATPHDHVTGDIEMPFRQGATGVIGGLLILGFRPLIEQALFAEAKAFAGDRGLDAATRAAKLVTLDAGISDVGITIETLLRSLEEAGVPMARSVGDDPAAVLAEVADDAN